MKNPDAPWSLPSEEVIRLLETNASQGLSSAEAAKRLSEFGKNTLRVERGTHWLRRLLDQFKSPMVITLLVATAFSGFFGDLVDAIAISAILVINAAIGYFQEAKAETAILALKHLAAPKARVLRDGQIITIAGVNICLGDILVLATGDHVGADARIISANQLTTDEAILTGESLPVEKNQSLLPQKTLLADQHNMIFADTLVASGTARALVTATGEASQVGRIAALLSSASRDATPLQKRIAQISRQLLILCAFIVVVIAALFAFQGLHWLQIMMTSVSLAVAAIPEGLPAVVTLALALATKRMVKRKAIVRNLPAIETLGSVEVICTDKTGTLTTGKMRVRETSELRESADFLRAALLCSNASLSGREVSGSPTELALLYLAQERGLNIKAVRSAHPRLAEWSFDSSRKRASVAVVRGDKIEIMAAGGPESILSVCELADGQRTKILNKLQAMTAQGYRVIALAHKKLPIAPNDFSSADFTDPSTVESGLVFLGLAALADPIRPESLEAVKACQQAGIQVVMITGDHPATAESIARELGIITNTTTRVMTGTELKDLSLEQLAERIEQIPVFARVTPEDKLKIVRAWKLRGKIIAMTGDGVNDAPALREASIGISMGQGGTEVARQASSMILVDDNFATIVSAIKEGRAIYGNIQRTIQYLLSQNLAEILVVFGAAVAGWATPFLPIQLLWLNLVTDGCPALALAAEPVPPDILSASERPSPKNFFDRDFSSQLLFVSLPMAILALGLYGLSMSYQSQIVARSYVFSFIVFAGIFCSFANRSKHRTYFHLGPFSNLWHLAAVVLPLGLHISLHYCSWFQSIFQVTSIAWTEFLGLILLALVPVTIIEVRKLLVQNRSKIIAGPA